MCRPKLEYKLEGFNNILNSTPSERYEMLEIAKDQVMKIAWTMRGNKYNEDKGWGYSNWVKITNYIRYNEYKKIIPIVVKQEPSKHRTLMLQYLDDIIALERSEY